MSKIVTTAEVQKKIGKISKTIEIEAYIVTSHGKGKMVMLPYFDGCDEALNDYMEDFEMAQNKEKLQKKYEKSSNSGESDLTI